VNLCHNRLKLSLKVDECKPLVAAAPALLEVRVDAAAVSAIEMAKVADVSGGRLAVDVCSLNPDEPPMCRLLLAEEMGACM